MSVILGSVMALWGDSLWANASKEMRYMSLTIRDQPISVSDAKAITAGTTTLDALIQNWLDSDEHKQRIRRYFNDQFGMGMDIFTVPDSYILQQQADGAYYLPDKGTCSDTVTITDAWWLEEGQSIRVCSNTRSDLIYYGYDNKEDVECTLAGNTGIGASECGCGTRMILCYPHDLATTLYNHIRYEFRERGLYVYENGLSWFDLLGGDFFYGSRVLWKHYLDQQALFRNIEPSLADLVTLSQLPLSTYTRASFPVSGSVERAGQLTSPGFLRQYNNFRSRINILTSRLLCQDVDGSLNTDGIATFVNQTLAADDQFLVRDHGSRADCSGCHYPMDNMGSTLWLWGPSGYYRYWGAVGAQDESGHVFGMAGQGPAFLATGYIERGAGFSECMAKTVWEDFSGGLWSDLGSIAKSQFTAKVAEGPQALIQAVLTSVEIRQLHYSGIPQTTVGGASVYSYDQDVNSILKASCSGGACHSQGTSLGSQYEFIDNEAGFAAANASRIDDGSMPPSSSSLSISDGDRAILKSWRDAQ